MIMMIGLFCSSVLGDKSLQIKSSEHSDLWETNVTFSLVCVWFGREIVKREVGNREYQKREKR